MKMQSSDENTLKVAIVGAGFSGIAAATQLTKQFSKAAAQGKTKQQRLAITLIDPRERAGGYTYNRHDVRVPMANPIGILGLERPEDFIEHMNQNPERWISIADSMDYKGLGHHEISGFNPQSFVTHNILGEYLNDCLTGLITECHREGSPVSVEVRYGVQAQDGCFSSSKGVVELSDGHALESDVVILATGNVEPRPIEPLVGKEGYYNLDDRGLDLKTVHETDTTVIVGAGNGAGFAVCSALLNGYEGKFILSCHEAKMPAVLGQSKAYQRGILTIESLQKIREEQGEVTVDDLVRLFKTEHKRAFSQGYKWRDVVDSIVPDANEMWQCLDQGEQIKIFKQYGYVWGHARYRMPEYHAHILEDMIAQGRLELKPGEKSIVPDTRRGGFIITRETGNLESPTETYRAEKIVNIRGPSGEIRHMSPIMRALHEKGEITEHPLGGIQTDIDMHVKNQALEPQKRLYAIGPILRGEFIEAMTIPAIRELAPRLASNVIRDHALKLEVA